MKGANEKNSRNSVHKFKITLKRKHKGRIQQEFVRIMSTFSYSFLHLRRQRLRAQKQNPVIIMYSLTQSFFSKDYQIGTFLFKLDWIKVGNVFWTVIIWIYYLSWYVNNGISHWNFLSKLDYLSVPIVRTMRAHRERYCSCWNIFFWLGRCGLRYYSVPNVVDTFIVKE